MSTRSRGGVPTRPGNSVSDARRQVDEFRLYLSQHQGISEASVTTYGAIVQRLLRLGVTGAEIPESILARFERQQTRDNYRSVWKKYAAWRSLEGDALQAAAGVPSTGDTRVALYDGHVPDKHLLAAIRLHQAVCERLQAVIVAHREVGEVLGDLDAWHLVESTIEGVDAHPVAKQSYLKAWPWLRALHRQKGHIPLPFVQVASYSDAETLYAGGLLAMVTDEPWFATWDMLTPVRGRGIISHTVSKGTQATEIPLNGAAMWELALRQDIGDANARALFLGDAVDAAQRLVCVKPGCVPLARAEWQQVLASSGEKKPEYFGRSLPAHMFQWLLPAEPARRVNLLDDVEEMESEFGTTESGLEELAALGAPGTVGAPGTHPAGASRASNLRGVDLLDDVADAD